METMMASQTLQAPPPELDMITPGEIESFRKNGFVLPRRGLDAETTETLRQTMEDVFRDTPDWHNLVRMPHVPKRPGQLEGVVGGERLFEIAVHPQLLAAARALVGPNLILWGGEIFAKPAAVGKSTPWHQDCYNPAIKAAPGRKLARSAMIWIAVDPVDVDNGCLRFVPGSGRDGRIEHKLQEKPDAMLNFEVEAETLRFDRAVDAVLAPGQFSVHDSYVVHGANPNRSGRRRAGITFHYMDAADAYDRSFGSATGTGTVGKPAPLAQRPIWLVLGENRNPINDFVTGHQNLEDLDDLAEKIRNRLNQILN